MRGGATGPNPRYTLPERTEHVLSCIYSVFTEGYWSTAGPSAIRDELCDEAVRLSAELCALLPDSRDAQALADYLSLLDDLEQNFQARTRKMLLDDRSDLTVEIDVLRERLQREGIRPD